MLLVGVVEVPPPLRRGGGEVIIKFRSPLLPAARAKQQRLAGKVSIKRKKIKRGTARDEPSGLTLFWWCLLRKGGGFP